MTAVHRRDRRLLASSVRFAAVLVIVVASLVVTATAGAHGTLGLSGKSARAGTNGTLTLTIPHGCPSGLATTKFVILLGSGWRSAKPTAVTGWATTVTRTASRQWLVTWTATAGGLPDTQAGNFPIAVGWPAKAATYQTPVYQYCGTAASFVWNDPYVDAADKSQVYPAFYPVPRVQVIST